VRPGTSSAGNYRSPGYGTNYGTNFAGGAGRYGGGSSGNSPGMANLIMSCGSGSGFTRSIPVGHVFGPPGYRSGSIYTRYGSGSFYQQAKIVRKTLIPTVLLLLLKFLSLKMM
jgi:hypothetical protein